MENALMVPVIVMRDGKEKTAMKEILYMELLRME